MSCEVCNDGCCLIDFGCIIDNTPLNTLSDETDVMQSLLLAQADMKKVIQDDCYDELCAAIQSGDPLSTKMEELKNAIKIPLSWLTFSKWLTWYANVTYGDSATTTVTDITSNKFANISSIERDALVVRAEGEYERFKNEALKAIKAIGLDCFNDPDCCQKCTTPRVDDETSYLPDVV